MSEEHLHRLEEARKETLRYMQELENRRKAREITEIEHKILLYTKFHGKSPGEILTHIAVQEHKAKERLRENRERSLVIASAALFVVFALIGALFFGSSPTTGYTTAEHKEHSAGWNGTVLENKTEADLATPKCPNPGSAGCEP
jgi:hypothetical protein